MKATFNGTCTDCGKWRPNCAVITIIQSKYGGGVMQLCAGCRKVNRGRYRLHEQHKEKQK